MQPVFGDMANAALGKGSGIGAVYRSTLYENMAGAGRPHPRQDLAELALAVARDPGDADNLAGVDIK